jgi:hypothetical protein
VSDCSLLVRTDFTSDEAYVFGWGRRRRSGTVFRLTAIWSENAFPSDEAFPVFVGEGGWRPGDLLCWARWPDTDESSLH